MDNKFELSASMRVSLGKSHNRRMRNTSLMPAVIYGGKENNVSVSIAHNEIQKALKNEAFYTQVINLDVEGKKEQVVVKDIQRHPYKKLILHMDFLRVSDTKEVVVKVPLHFINENAAPGVKHGGKIFHLMTEIEVSCFPKNIPIFIEVDLGSLELDKAIHLQEVSLPAHVKLTSSDNNDAVASIHKVKEKAVAQAPEEGQETTNSENS